MKSQKEFKCGGIVPIVDIKKGKNSQIFDEITIRASPPIYSSGCYHNTVWPAKFCSIFKPNYNT